MVLDTSAYSALKKGSNEVVQAVAKASGLIMPVVVVGELRYGFIKSSKPTENENTLQRFLAADGVEVAEIGLETTGHYAELYNHARQKGKALSHNDLWIAAIAKHLHVELLTLDRDFDVLRELLPAGLVIV